MIFRMEDINNESLIEAVEGRPAIWDMRSALYGDREKRRKSWEEVVVLFLGDSTSTASVEEKKALGRMFLFILLNGYMVNRKTNR